MYVSLIQLPPRTCRYKIIAPAAVDKAGGDMKKVADAILEGAGLEADQFRLGHTKAWFFILHRTAHCFFLFFFS